MTAKSAEAKGIPFSLYRSPPMALESVRMAGKRIYVLNAMEVGMGVCDVFTVNL